MASKSRGVWLMYVGKRRLVTATCIQLCAIHRLTRECLEQEEPVLCTLLSRSSDLRRLIAGQRRSKVGSSPKSPPGRSSNKNTEGNTRDKRFEDHENTTARDIEENIERAKALLGRSVKVHTRTLSRSLSILISWMASTHEFNP